VKYSQETSATILGNLRTLAHDEETKSECREIQAFERFKEDAVFEAAIA